MDHNSAFNCPQIRKVKIIGKGQEYHTALSLFKSCFFVIWHIYKYNAMSTMQPGPRPQAQFPGPSAFNITHIT